MIKATMSFAAIGECMLELRHENSDTLKLGFGGDTYNVSVYVARLLPKTSYRVDYVTALGDDPYSDQMIQAWNQEHINTENVFRLSQRLPGAYFIRTEDDGERHFFYYRELAAAKLLFKEGRGSILKHQLANMNYLYFSSISLAILDEESREIFLDIVMHAHQNGVKVVFDTNYRPRLWQDKIIAQRTITNFMRFVDIALLTFSDEQLLFGDSSPQDAVERCEVLGINEVAVKCGAEPCLSFANKELNWVPGVVVENVVDTTAAGDSFNGGYIAARMQNLSPVKAVEWGHAVASQVIQYPGAIIPLSAMPDLRA